MVAKQGIPETGNIFLFDRKIRKEEFRTEFQRLLKMGIDSGPSLHSADDFIAKGKQRLRYKITQKPI